MMHTQRVMHSPRLELRMYTNGGYMCVQVHPTLTAKFISSINQTKWNTNDAHSNGHVCAPTQTPSTKRIQMVAMFGHTQTLTTKALTSEHTVSHKRLAML